MWKKTTVEEAEKNNMVKDDRLGPDAIPFGFMNDQWMSLLRCMEEDDELYEFSSDGDAWENLSGMQGISVVRNGVTVDTLVTCRS